MIHYSISLFGAKKTSAPKLRNLNNSYGISRDLFNAVTLLNPSNKFRYLDTINEAFVNYRISLLKILLRTLKNFRLTKREKFVWILFINVRRK